MPPSSPWNAWLRRLRHDLVKRLLWPARDRLDLGGAVQPGELVVALVDDEGGPATASAVWASLRKTAPTPGHAALPAFESAVQHAIDAARRDDLAGVLALQAAFDQLAQQLASEK